MRSRFKFDLVKDKLQCNKSIMKTVRPAVLAWEEMPYLWEKTLALPTVLQEKKQDKRNQSPFSCEKYRSNVSVVEQV